VPKILQMFKRMKQSKSQRQGVSNAFMKVLGAEVIQFPMEREELQRPSEPRLSEDTPDYETITRWLQLADELLASEGRVSDWPGSEERGDTRDRKEA
jgi:hypothetical protein